MGSGIGEKISSAEEWLRAWLTGPRLESIVNVFLVFLLGISVSFLMTLYVEQIPPNTTVGSIAVKDIKADQNYEIVDEKSSSTVREEARDSVLPVYDLDASLETNAIKKIHDSFDESRTFLAENLTVRNDKRFLSDDLEGQLKREFFERLGVEASDEQYSMLRRHQFDPAIEKTLGFLIHGALQNRVVSSKEELHDLTEKGFVSRLLSTEGPPQEQIVTSLDGIHDVAETKSRLENTKLELIQDEFRLGLIKKDSLDAIKEVAALFVRANFYFNSLETDSRKLKAENNVKNIIIKVKRGESIIRSGDRFEPWHLTVLEGIRKARFETNRMLGFLGTFIFVNLVLFIVYFFSSKYIKKFKPNRKDLIFIGVTLISLMVVLRLGVFISISIRDALPFNTTTTTLYYAIPIAAGAMLVRFMLNSETALLFSMIVSIFAGIFLENNLEMMVYYLMTGVFAAYTIAHVDRRSTVLLSGLYTGMMSSLMILSLNLISSISMPAQVSISTIGVNILFGLLGGLFSSMLVLILAPIGEALFGYTTDIKLLELANLSHPLLKEMIVTSPGTYHHSQLVGILSEGAAQSIGANPLLARVASYYHDIGKMKKSQYFIENQRGGNNPHDKLAPSMSALIIESHVKDGIEMAREHKLPQRIADMIPQHQGTKLIGYFYNKAKKIEDPAIIGKVEERDYRYPGPKPQTREAGIIMLADTVEAAVRSLPEKTPNKIQSTVEKLVNQHFVDEQLDECDLTLRDLHAITQSFIKILMGIYHQRVEYPEGALVMGQSSQVHFLNDQIKRKDGTAPQLSASTGASVAALFRKKD